MSTENIKTSLGNNEENNESFVDPSVIDFKRRLESFSIDLDLSKFGHIDSDEHGEAGEISLGAREVIDDNVNELNIQLSSQRSKLFNKSESPYFSESSERPLKMSEVNNLFFKTLESEGYPVPVVHKIMDIHVYPSASQVYDEGSNQKKINEEKRQLKEDKVVDTENPFATLVAQDVSSSEEEVNYYHTALIRHFQLLHNILNHPEEFGLNKEELPDKLHEVKLTTEEFKQRLNDSDLPIHEIFIVNGVEVRTAVKSQIVKKLISEKFNTEFPHQTDLQKEKTEELKLSFLRNIPFTIIHDMYELEKKKDSVRYSPKNKEVLAVLNAKLVTLLEDFLDEGDEGSGRKSGFVRYGNLLINGLDDENNVYDWPSLTLRLPLAVKYAVNTERNPARRSELKDNFYHELVTKRYNPEKSELLKATYLGNASDSLELIHTDEAGDKPVKLIIAEVRYLLEEVGYNEEDQIKALGNIGVSYFDELNYLRNSLNEIKGKPDTSNNEIKAIKVRIRNETKSFVVAVRNRLNDPSGTLKILDAGIKPQELEKYE